MKKMEIKISSNLALNIKKAALDTETEINNLITEAIVVYLTILTLDKEKAKILAGIINQQDRIIREEIK